MNTFGATSPGPRPVAEMPANRTGGEAAEDRADGANPFGAVLGALHGTGAEAAPVSQPARPGRRREADGAEAAPVSDPLGMLAAVAVAPMPAAVVAAAAESTGKTGPIAFETLVALAVPERPAGLRREPAAVPAPGASLPGETAVPALAAAPETGPVDATVPAIQPSAIAALVPSLAPVQGRAPAQAFAPGEGPPLSAPGGVPPSGQPAAAPAQARPRVTVLRQETHFAPVMPRSLGILAAAPAPVPPLLPGDGPSPAPVAPVPVATTAPHASPVAAPIPATPVSPLATVHPALSQAMPAAPAFARGEPRPVQAAVGRDEARAVAAPVVGGNSLPSVAPVSMTALEAPTDPVAVSRSTAPSATIVPAANPSPAVAAAQPGVSRPAQDMTPATPVPASPPAHSALPASPAAASEPAIEAPADPIAAAPASPAASPQPAPVPPVTEAVPPSLVRETVTPVRSEPTPAAQGAPPAETTVAPRHTALGLAGSGEAGIAGREAAAETDPGGAVPAPQPAAPLPASGLASGAPSSAPVRQIAEAVAAEAARAGSAQPGALPGQPGSEGPLRILTLQLRPMDLGTVVVRMRLRGSQLEMSLHANHAETADLLRKDGALLSALLRDAGYHPDAVTIGAAPAEPASGNASASGQGAPSESGGQNPGREMSDQPARRQPGMGADRINDARERTNDTNPAGPDRSGVYL